MWHVTDGASSRLWRSAPAFWAPAAAATRTWASSRRWQHLRAGRDDPGRLARGGAGRRVRDHGRRRWARRPSASSGSAAATSALRALRALERHIGRPLHARRAGRDRRLQLDAADDRRRPDRAAGDRRRRHGPRLPRVADGHLHDLRRARRRRARWPIRAATRSSSTGIADPTTLERYARAVTIQMGGAAGYAFPPMTGASERARRSPARSRWPSRSGSAVLVPRAGARQPGRRGARRHRRAAALPRQDRRRRAAAGRRVRPRRAASSTAAARDAGRALRIDFQNENLIARTGDGEHPGRRPRSDLPRRRGHGRTDHDRDRALRSARRGARHPRAGDAEDAGGAGGDRPRRVRLSGRAVRAVAGALRRRGPTGGRDGGAFVGAHGDAPGCRPPRFTHLRCVGIRGRAHRHAPLRRGPRSPSLAKRERGLGGEGLVLSFTAPGAPRSSPDTAQPVPPRRGRGRRRRGCR